MLSSGEGCYHPSVVLSSQVCEGQNVIIWGGGVIIWDDNMLSSESSVIISKGGYVIICGGGCYHLKRVWCYHLGGIVIIWK